MENEIWKPVVGYEGLYEVSNLGNVSSLNYRRKGYRKLLKGSTVNGHKIIKISNGKIGITYSISRLVAEHFISNPNNLPCACHKDETLDKNLALYNGADNLFWGTYSDNTKDMYSKGRANNHLQLYNPYKGKLGKYHCASKEVYQYTLYGKFIKEWGSTIDVKRELGITQSSISRCCNGKLKTSGGFIWKYKNKIEPSDSRE